MEALNIVVVGPGLIGKEHIRLIHENKKCQLVALVAPDHVPNHAIARANQVPLFYDISACLASCKVDGVVISSPNQFHAEQAAICVKAGIPVLVEKPITATVEEGEALVRLAAQYDARILIGHHRAHSPLLAKAREIISEGRLGHLVSVSGSAQFYKPQSYFQAGLWRTQPGGGPILINMIHEIGNLRTLCGEICAVHAFASSSIRRYPVEDTVSINLMFENGMLGNFILSDTAACARSWEQTSRENPAYPTYKDEDCYVVSGTLGSLSIPTFRLKHYRDEEQASWWEPFIEEVLNVERKDPLSCQLAHFVAVINERVEPLVSAADGLRNLKITEAISRSAQEGRVVHV
ncbi:Gfo/Idh/MocA family protein [Comamonas sp. J-3]|uniref:Gfo/Idh/MocA family protein n=1 Tax=Comamonas trifloxystrobinivorans TaxID=3350256 RepID=UPI0037295BD6